MQNDRDLLRIWLNFSEASRQEASTAEENVMRLLIIEIQDLLKSIIPGDPRRIWTLHKFVGNQIQFHKSNNFQRSAHHRDLIRSVNDGLIGEAIRRNDDDVVIFKNVNNEDKYISGWDDCQSELISLVRDSRSNIIGVINIESNIPDDFICANDAITSEDKDTFKKLKDIMYIASNYISVIFRNQSLIEGEKSTANLITSISEAPLVTRAVLQTIISNLSHWLNDRAKLLRVIVYITEPGDKNKYRRLSKIDLASESKSVGIPYEILYEEKMRFLFEKSLRPFSSSTITDIFGREFSDSLLSGSDESAIYFVASEVLDSHQKLSQKTSARYFIGVVFSEIFIKNIETVQTFFEVAKNMTEKHLKYKLDAHNSLFNRATVEIYKTMLQEDSLRIALNKIATQIADETEARFCMIYLVATEEVYHSRHKFYLGGVGKGTVDFADIRLEQNNSIVGYVLNQQEKFYSDDFYNCEQNKHLLDRDLKEQGLERPEVYAFPLSMQDFGNTTKIGVLVLFRENSDMTSGNNRLNPEQVKLRLSDWTEYLSTIICKRQKQSDEMLTETLKKLVEILPNVVQHGFPTNIITQLQIQIKKEVLPLWQEIMNPAIFIVYKDTGEKIQMVDPSILPRVTISPPDFKRTQGLTGSVMKYGEIYEPFIEDFDPFIDDQSASSQLSELIPTPDRLCTAFWDGALGDKRRMYYGRHIIINSDDYILLIVGVRQNKFLPSFCYKLVREFTDVIYQMLKRSSEI
jgi:hypothetical protein